MKKISSLALAAIVTGCSGNAGPVYSSLPGAAKQPKHGMAQLVVYHPMEFTGSVPIGSGPDVKINGVVACALPTGGFFITSSQPGATHISSTKLLSIGTSVLDIKTAANERYFVRITWNSTKLLAGDIGEIATQGTSYRSGPFVIESVNESTATEELQSLKMVSGCKP